MDKDRVILWDFDGTLVSRPSMWSEAVLASLDEAVPDHRLTRGMISEHLQTGFPWHDPMVPHPELNDPDVWWAKVCEVCTPIFRGLDCDDGACKTLNEAIRRDILDPNRYNIFEDVVPNLEALSSADWRHVILSNHVPELQELVSGLELMDHFDLVLTSGLTGYEKPHPEAFRIAKQIVGNARTVVMVGDNPVADVAGAERAGIPGYLVRTESVDVRRQAADLFELQKLLEPRNLR